MAAMQDENKDCFLCSFKTIIFLSLLMVAAFFAITWYQNDNKDKKTLTDPKQKTEATVNNKTDSNNNTPKIQGNINDLPVGMSLKKKDIYDNNSATKKIIDGLVYLQIEPSKFKIEIEKTYPPKTIRDWCQDSTVVAIINGGFFTEDYDPTALLITKDGKEAKSYTGENKGMFFVDKTNKIGVKNLKAGAGDVTGFSYALQAFPMLVEKGKSVVNLNSERQAARSIVGINKQGDLIIGVTEKALFTLDKFGLFLADDSLEFETVLNLDGGSSSGLCVKDNQGKFVYENYGLSLIPYVIVIRK